MRPTVVVLKNFPKNFDRLESLTWVEKEAIRTFRDIKCENYQYLIFEDYEGN